MVKIIVREVERDTEPIVMGLLSQTDGIISTNCVDYGIGEFIDALSFGMDNSAIILSDRVQIPTNFIEKAKVVINEYPTDIISFKHDLDVGSSGLHDINQFGVVDALYIPATRLNHIIEYYNDNHFRRELDPVIFFKSYMNNQSINFIASYPEMVVIDDGV